MVDSVMVFNFRHMRTHARYEMQDSTSLEEAAAPPGLGPDHDSPNPGSVGHFPVRMFSPGSRGGLPETITGPSHAQSKPPNRMDTGEDSGHFEDRPG